MEIDFKNYKMNFLRFFMEDEMSFLSKTKGEIHTQNFLHYVVEKLLLLGVRMNPILV